MACQRPSPIVMFDHDIPVATFRVTADGEPLNLNNFEPELHLINSEGSHVAQFVLTSLGLGSLTLGAGLDQTAEEFYEVLFSLEPNTTYRAQIFLKAVAPPTMELGLYDIIEPYWADYIPPESHIPGWYSGEVKLDQTIPTEFPWLVREAFKLRGI